MGYTALRVFRTMVLALALFTVPLAAQEALGDTHEAPRVETLGEMDWYAMALVQHEGAGEGPERFGPEVSVPEPSTWLLLGIGMLGIGFVAWRRKDVLA